MNNDFKKGFFAGAGGILGVLSIPLGLYVLYLLYGLVSPQINKILVKQEFRDWSECFFSISNQNDSYEYNEKEGLENNVENIRAYLTKKCGEKPKPYKWQPKK